jgi:hypothetical protein
LEKGITSIIYEKDEEKNESFLEQYKENEKNVRKKKYN